MELTRIGIEFKDMKQAAFIQNMMADIVLIDRTTDGVQPMLYMLKQDRTFTEQDLDSIKQGIMTFDRDAFIQLGEVLSVDKRNKHIILTNQNTITYSHLIIASGTHNALLSYEFLAGVQTLVDALRVRKKVPSSFAPANKSTGSKKQKKMTSSREQSPQKTDIDKVRLKKLVEASKSSSTPAPSPKILYEVQL